MVSFHGADDSLHMPWPGSESSVQARWAKLQGEVSARQPVCISPAPAEGGDVLLALAVRTPQGAAVAGLALTPPCTERTVQVALLSVPWLEDAWRQHDQLTLARSARLLDLLAHVASHDEARAAAQDWVNRSAALARDLWPQGAAPGLSLSYFHVNGERPRWWVTSETAWAERGAPALDAATELASEAAVTLQECRPSGGWAWPVVDGGEAVGVLVARLEADLPVPEDVVQGWRASVALAEPLLRRWHEAERGLISHAWQSARHTWRRAVGPGHLSWKAAAMAGLLALGGLAWWPVADRVTANTVIEGQQRRLVTAPFDGFVAQVMVRPGERVQAQQELARLDDRDIRLEQAQQRSARDQAQAKLRQALGDHDAAAAAQAQAELQQAEAQLHLANTRLDRVSLRAPMAGLVVSGDWSQKLGSPIEVGKDMFEVADTGGYRVVLHVPDRDITRVRVGQTGHIRLTGHPGVSYPFAVSRVTATASVSDNVNGFRVEARWLGQVPALSPGMQGVGKVDVGDTTLLDVWTRPTRDWLQLKLWSWWW
jgi:multidrug resistance efflux pump